VVATDAEIPAATGYAALLAGIGFHSIEEIQPSRHRYTLPLGHGADEESVFGGIAKSTRQRIRGAEKDGIRVVRHDRAAGAGADGGATMGAGPGHATPGPGFAAPAEPLAAALDRFYDLLLLTGERRHFAFGPRASYLAWWQARPAPGPFVL